jgi:hypothetical protein
MAAESLGWGAYSVGLPTVLAGAATAVTAIYAPYASTAGSIISKSLSIEVDAIASLKTIAKSNLPLFKSAFDEATSPFAVSNDKHVKTAYSSISGPEFDAQLYNMVVGPSPRP